MKKQQQKIQVLVITIALGKGRIFKLSILNSIEFFQQDKAILEKLLVHASNIFSRYCMKNNNFKAQLEEKKPPFSTLSKICPLNEQAATSKIGQGHQQ